MVAAEAKLDATCSDLANAMREQRRLEDQLQAAKDEVAYRDRLKCEAGDALRAARKRWQQSRNS